MASFDTVYELFWDDIYITFMEDDTIPEVVDPDNPMGFEIRYYPIDKIWHCTADFLCRNQKDTYVSMTREYTSDMVGYMEYLNCLKDNG